MIIIFLMAALVTTGPALAQAPVAEPSQAYENALLHFNREDYAAALIELKNALQQNPHNLAARVLIGRAYLRLNDAPSAEAALSLARQAGADENLVLPALADAYLRQGKYQELIEKIRSGGQDPDAAAQILAARGWAYLALRQEDQAEQAFRDAARLQPEAAPLLLGQAQVLRRRGEFKAAEALVDRATALAPEEAGTWYMKGELRRLQQDLPGAVANFDKAIQLKPEHIEARLGRAAALLDQNLNDSALTDIAYVRQVFPRQPQAAYLHALALARAGDKARAQEILRDAEQYLSQFKPTPFFDEHSLDLVSGVLNFTLDNFEKARPALSRFVEQNPHHAGARRLLGVILVQQGEAAKAIQILQPALAQAPDDPRLLALLGQAYLGAQRPADAMSLLDKAVQLAPEQADGYTQRALGRLAVGRPAEAVEDLKQALALDSGAVPAGLLLGRIYLEQQDYEAALRIAWDLGRHAPANPAVHDLAGSAQLGKGDSAAALASFSRALAVDPAYLPAQFNLADAELKAGHPDRARALYQAILGRYPREVRALIGLARVAEAEKHLEEAIRWLEKVRDFDKGAVASHLHLIELYSQTRQPGTALEVAQQLRTHHPKSPLVLEAVGRAELALGKKAEAAATFRQLAALAADSPRLLYQVAHLQTQAGDVRGAVNALQRVTLSDPDFLPAWAALVEAKLRLGELDEALRLARRLRDSHPRQATGDLLAGDVLMRMSRFTEAADAYTRARQKEETPAVLLRLYQAHWQAGARERALQLLAQGLKAHPEDSELEGALATGYLAAGRLAEAKTHYERLLDKHSDNASLLNNLAWIYQQMGDPRALAHAEQAYRLEPDSPAVLDTLGWILVQQGEAARALRFLRDAQARSAKDPQVRYHLAVALSRLGRPEEARLHLQEALAADPAFKEAGEVRALLKQLTGR